MIRRLRRKLIGVVMLSLTVILIIVVGAINIVSYRQITAQADRVLDILQENQGKFPDKLPQPPQDDAGKPPYAGNHDFITEDTPFESRYFVVNDKTLPEKSVGWILGISLLSVQVTRNPTEKKFFRREKPAVIAIPTVTAYRIQITVSRLFFCTVIQSCIQPVTSWLLRWLWLWRYL